MLHKAGFMVLTQRNAAHGDKSIKFPLKTKQYNVFVLNTLAHVYTSVFSPAWTRHTSTYCVYVYWMNLTGVGSCYFY